MSPLRQQMIRELRLQRMSDNTVKAYVVAVEQLARHYSRSPAGLSQDEVRELDGQLVSEGDLVGDETATAHTDRRGRLGDRDRSTEYGVEGDVVVESLARAGAERVIERETQVVARDRRRRGREL